MKDTKDAEYKMRLISKLQILILIVFVLLLILLISL